MSVSPTQARGPAGAQSAAQHREQMLAAAQNAGTTPFDYIVIGSGAGGGSLAARLAESEQGVRVLVLEAGGDPAGDAGAAREVYEVPAYHGAATEDEAMCWSFSVRHYEDDGLQRRDSKYAASQDPSTGGRAGKGGILYPRSSGLGGCTGHFAMIVVKPNDCDWDWIAAMTGDESWRAQEMQGYFGRIENCLYYQSYQGFLRKVFLLYAGLRRVVGWINPRWQLDAGGHGFGGWQQTSFIDPELVVKIAWGDRTFLRVLFDVFRFLWTRKGQLAALLGSLLRLQVVQFLDPNFGTQRASHSGRTAFIPIATDGRRRFSLRERLLSVAQQLPQRLVLLSGVLATRLIFKGEPGRPPQAVGVEVDAGLHLYEASPLHARAAGSACTRQFFARREVVVAGGAFNTPQLLMLSGIGDAAHLRQMGIQGPRDAAGVPVCDVIQLPGVGRNLQDRYEVSVISEARSDFSTLQGVSFKPGDPQDPAREQWLRTGAGLYATNGGAVAFFLKTRQAVEGQPDLFIFGAPAAFRGYYWGWSRELLRARKGAMEEQRNLWSWILLKAYTRNHGGTVRLRDASARSQPEINFHSFGEGCAADEAAADVEALAEGITFVRKMNAGVSVFGREVQPGEAVGEAELPQWIASEAWGHHACGTCRMGSDPWAADVRKLRDTGAVLDSQFRVHGVRGLRVVDTSVFPRIPGYFIVTPTFMIGEKAADALLADSDTYPGKLEAAEACAIRNRRRRARLPESTFAAQSQASQRLPADTVGLALSGGGVRSATFCLGVLQGLARKGFLSRVDVLSSVSGGGYIAAFLGRLYTRMRESVADPAQRVESILSDIASPQVFWLRSHARYLTGAGRTDLETNAGTVWRNLVSVHFCVALLIVAVELLLSGLETGFGLPRPRLALVGLGLSVTLSSWWWSVPAALMLGVLPAWFGFWLAPKPGTTASLSLGALPVWLLALFGSGVLSVTTQAFFPSLLAMAILLLCWVWQEVALWYVDGMAEQDTSGIVARNRLGRANGITLGIFGVTVLWVVIDTFAEYSAASSPQWPTAIMCAVATSLPGLRVLVMRLGGSQPDRPRDQKAAGLARLVLLGAIAFGLAGLLVFGLDVIAHWAFQRATRGWWFLASATVLSLAIGRATGFINLSSLGSLYAARLARTYLGATNQERTGAAENSPARDVDSAQPDDDVFLCDYHPEAHGGPLHLINVCVNETVDVTSGRQLAQDKGLPMCLGPAGVSVGLRFHALWDRVESGSLRMRQWILRMLEHRHDATKAAKKSGLTALLPDPDPETFHVLASRRQRPTVPVESLRLSEWTAISGAAVSTGQGRKTSLPTSLLLGFFNFRLGYWWNSGISAGDRPGRYPPSLWRRVKAAPGYLLRTQSTILNEWRGYFAGPSQRLWYLSDGGHADNTGLYELFRRRLPFILAVDAEEDPGYTFEEVGMLVRRVRLDFGAEVQWIDPTEARRQGACGWQAIEQSGGVDLPAWIRQWLDPNAVGGLESVTRRGAFAAAMARVDYDGVPECSWLVMLKASLASPPAIPLDVQCYSKGNDAFPNQTTLDQFFSDDQWESYRLLGETLVGRVIKAVS
jgi:choline dehydrogenase-like flavoprotein